MGDTLLSYAVSSNPDPIQASPQAGGPSLASLIIVVSNDTHHLIDCSSLSFGFLKGTDAKDFFSDATGITTTRPKGWKLEQSGALFTATPDSSKDGTIGADGLTFVLSNIKVNEQPGRTDMTVTEVTATAHGAAHTGTLALPLNKFPPQFEVGDLQVSPPPPVAPGSNVMLIWSGSDDGATYEIQYEDADGNTVSITHVKGEPDTPLPSTGSYTIDALQQDTTFYLIVTLQVPGNDQPLRVERYFPVTVRQAQPEITLFEGKLELVSAVWNLVLNWETKHAASCTINVDPHPVNPSSRGDIYKIPLTWNDPPSAPYILTATNNIGSVSSQITVDWRLKLVDSVKVASSAWGIAVSPDNTRIYVANTYDGNLMVVDAATLRPGKESFQMDAVSVAASPDGRRVYAVDQNQNALFVLDARTLQPTSNSFYLLDGASIAISPDGTRLYVISSGYTLSTLDAQTLHPVGSSFPFTDEITGMAASPDGTRLYVVTYPPSLFVLDAQTLQPIGNPTPMNGSFTGIAASPDGTRLYLSSNGEGEYGLVILDAHTLQPIGNRIGLEGDDPFSVCFSTNLRSYVGGRLGMLFVFSEATVTKGKQPA